MGRLLKGLHPTPSMVIPVALGPSWLGRGHVCGKALPWLLGSGVGKASGHLARGFLRSRWTSEQGKQSTLVSALPELVDLKP